jgi:protein TonB
MIEDTAEPATLAASAVLTGSGVALLLLVGGAWPPDAPALAERAVEIALMAEPAPPPAPAAIPAAPLSRSQVLEETPLRDPPPRTQAAADLAAPRPPKHHASPSANTAPQREPAHAALADKPAAPATPAPPAGNPSEDARYTTLVHATIERNKRNPDTPLYRMMHPHGTARVLFTLDRNGAASGVRIADSSGVAMLDDQAVRIVQTCQFPPMPAPAFAGSSFHVFTVVIRFPPFGMAD